MRDGLTRRRFVRAGLGVSAAVASAGVWDRLAVAGPPLIRRDVGGLTANHSLIVSYRKAVAAMKALPSTDPRCWSYQAAIHGTMATPVQTAWNSCAHGTYFFWSWHRMYVYWFERIVRKMSGDCTWTLPFWDWTSPAERQLPSMFRDPSSELYVSNRSAAINSGAGSLLASTVDTSALSILDFTSASNALQGTPHGAVHVAVGGWMSSVPTAAQDPIFYLHHCNMDRLWNLWLAQGGGRTDPLSDATWKTTSFTFFDENGATVHMTGCDVLRASEEADYAYEGEPPEVKEYCLVTFKPPRFVFTRRVLLKLPIPPVALGSEPVKTELDLAKVLPRMREAVKTANQRLLLELDDVAADRQPGIIWEVYLGDSPASDDAGEKNPRYIGNVVLFGGGIRAEGHHGSEPARFSFPITRATLDTVDVKQTRVALTFVPRGLLVNGKPSRPKAEAEVRIGSVSLTLESAKSR